MNLDYIVYPILTLAALWLFFGKNGAHPLLRRKPKQTTWCFCPACKVDLCSNDSLIYDHPEKSEVVYKCRERYCGNVSWWNFDIAPIPILIKSDDGSSDIKPQAIKATESHSSEATEAEGGVNP